MLAAVDTGVQVLDLPEVLRCETTSNAAYAGLSSSLPGYKPSRVSAVLGCTRRTRLCSEASFHHQRTQGRISKHPKAS